MTFRLAAYALCIDDGRGPRVSAVPKLTVRHFPVCLMRLSGAPVPAALGVPADQRGSGAAVKRPGRQHGWVRPPRESGQ
jgi:hypothetical protein